MIEYRSMRGLHNAEDRAQYCLNIWDNQNASLEDIYEIERELDRRFDHFIVNGFDSKNNENFCMRVETANRAMGAMFDYRNRGDKITIWGYEKDFARNGALIFVHRS